MTCDVTEQTVQSCIMTCDATEQTVQSCIMTCDVTEQTVQSCIMTCDVTEQTVQSCLRCVIYSAGGPPPTTSTVNGVCPDNTWSAYGEYCYQLVTSAQRSWPEARYACSVMGATLASVHSQGEMNFVANLFSQATFNGVDNTASVWLGLSKGLAGKKIRLLSDEKKDRDVDRKFDTYKYYHNVNINKYFINISLLSEVMT